MLFKSKLLASFLAFGVLGTAGAATSIYHKEVKEFLNPSQNTSDQPGEKTNSKVPALIIKKPEISDSEKIDQTDQKTSEQPKINSSIDESTSKKPESPVQEPIPAEETTVSESNLEPKTT